MKRYLFWAILVLIATGGLFLRLNNYDRTPPFGETMDEFMYPFAGISLLKSGVPTSWTGFVLYPDSYEREIWGTNLRFASPWNEKPPLYPLLTGTVSLLSGEDSFAKVRLTTIRLVPITLSAISIVLIGLLASSVWGPGVGILSAAIYATAPIFVLAGRLSVTENLLVPLSLLALWLYSRRISGSKYFTAVAVGICIGLALLTKNTAIALLFAFVFHLVIRRAWREMVVLIAIAFGLGSIYYILGYLYGWPLFMAVLGEYRRAMAIGLPETIQSLLRFPVIAHKEGIFPDGTLFAGYLLLLSSPFWLNKSIRTAHNSPASPAGGQLTTHNLLLYPYIYLLMYAVLVGGQTWFGWHLFPVYPFLAIILGYTLVSLWRHRDLPQFVVMTLILGASSLRFILLLHPQYTHLWPTLLGLMVLLGMTTWLPIFKRLQLLVLGGLCLFYFFANIYTVIHLSEIYPTKPQPSAYPAVQP